MPTVTSCRSCGAANFESVLDLGSTPLANALLTKEQCVEPEKKYLLHLVRCPGCSLLQITENIPGEELFSHYFYQSSFSDAFLRHCKELAEKVILERRLTAESLVVDIASNDGYLLQYYKNLGIPVLGIEPAGNIVEVAREKGIETRHAFFTNNEAKLMAKDALADVIHAHNVMPHVGNQRDFAAGIKTLLKPTGIAIIEFAYGIDTIKHTEFDQMYHEHMCYFSLTSFSRLCEREGLSISHVERIPVHGGSLRVFLMHTESVAPSESVTALLTEEAAWGVDTSAPYNAFRDRATSLQKDLPELLKKLKAEGKRIAAYGASAKGATLMNSSGITNELIEYVVDRSTVKQGYYTPGTHLKIEPVEKLLEDQPDYVLLLTWNFAEEITSQQKEYRERGGKFIVPVPEIRIV